MVLGRNLLIWRTFQLYLRMKLDRCLYLCLDNDDVDMSHKFDE